MKHFCLTVLFAADSGGEGEVTSASRDLGEAESPYRGCHPDLTRGPAGHPSQAHHALTSNPAGCNTNPQLKLVLKFWVGGAWWLSSQSVSKVRVMWTLSLRLGASLNLLWSKMESTYLGASSQ